MSEPGLAILEEATETLTRPNYADMRELANGGMKQVNALLAKGWVLLGIYQVAKGEERKDGVSYVRKYASFVVGRPESVAPDEVADKSEPAEREE